MKLDIVTSEFERTVRELLEHYLRADGSDPHELKLAQKHEALPLGFDYLGWTLLKPNGDLIGVSVFDHEAWIINEPKTLVSALLWGSERFLPLATLLPIRPMPAVDCSTCSGQGRMPSHKRIYCPECGGLGWKPV